MKNYTKIVVTLSILVCVCLMLIGLWDTFSSKDTKKEGWVDYKDWERTIPGYEEKKVARDKYKEVNRAISKRRRERNLARQHGKNLKAIFDYVDR